MAIIEFSLTFRLGTLPTVLDVSDDIQHALGFSSADFLSGRVTFQSRVHFEDQDLVDFLFGNSAAVGSFTLRMRHANGRIRIFRLNYIKTDAAEGAKLALQFQDAKSLYDHSSTLSANFRAMMDNTDDFIYFKDSNHVFTGASQTLVKLCSPAEHWSDLLGVTDYDVFPEVYADIYYALEKQVFSGVKVAHEIQKILTKEGAAGWVDNRKYPIEDSDGRVIGLFGVARDITAMKKNEEALLFRQFSLDHTQDEVYWIAKDGRVLDVNETACINSGYLRSDLLKLTVADFDPNFPLERWAEHWQELKDSGSLTFESLRRGRDGNCCPTEVVANYFEYEGEEYNCAFVRDITTRKQTEMQIWRQANFDRLTALPNRALFFDRLSKELSKSIRSHKYSALLFLDLDGFKPVNDQYGHEAGDEVLKIVAKRWQACIREVDTLARIGGDEFAVVVDGLEAPELATHVAKKMIAALSSKVPLPNSQECKIGVSIGIAIFPNNATEMDSLVSAADAAMYESKLKGKNTFTFSTSLPFKNNESRDWIVFDDNHLVGVAKIDEQHQYLVRLVNQLNYEIVQCNESLNVQKLFEELVKFAVFHFETEHKLMMEFGFVEINQHDKEHGLLISQIRALSKQIDQGSELLMLQTIKDWLLVHILHSDKPLANFIKLRGGS